MIGVLRRGVVVLACFFFVCMEAFGGELRVGGGYGEQAGFTEYTQNNAVVDVLYDFYCLDHNHWQFSLGTGLS